MNMTVNNVRKYNHRAKKAILSTDTLDPRFELTLNVTNTRSQSSQATPSDMLNGQRIS